MTEPKDTWSEMPQVMALAKRQLNSTLDTQNLLSRNCRVDREHSINSAADALIAIPQSVIP